MTNKKTNKKPTDAYRSREEIYSNLTASTFIQSASGSEQKEFVVDNATLPAAGTSPVKAPMVQIQIQRHQQVLLDRGRTSVSSESLTRPLPRPHVFMTTRHPCLFPLQFIDAPTPPSLAVAGCVCVRNMFSRQLPRSHVTLHSSLFRKYMMHEPRRPTANVQGEPPQTL